MFGVATVLLGLQLLALAHGDVSVQDVQPAGGNRSHCGNPIFNLKCVVLEIITNVLEGLRDHPAINPVKFGDVDKNVTTGHNDLHVLLNSAILEGLPDFVVDFIDLTMGSGRLDLTLSFPIINITAPKYIIRGIAAGVLIMDAEGPLEITFGKATLAAYATVLLQTSPPYILGVENLNCNVTAESFTFEMTNILGSLSDELNEMMTEIGLDILALSADKIEALLARYLENLINNAIPGKGLKDELMMNSEREAVLEELTENVRQLLNIKLLNRKPQMKNSQYYA